MPSINSSDAIHSSGWPAKPILNALVLPKPPYCKMIVTYTEIRILTYILMVMTSVAQQLQQRLVAEYQKTFKNWLYPVVQWKQNFHLEMFMRLMKNLGGHQTIISQAPHYVGIWRRKLILSYHTQCHFENCCLALLVVYIFFSIWKHKDKLPVHLCSIKRGPCQKYHISLTHLWVEKTLLSLDGYTKSLYWASATRLICILILTSLAMFGKPMYISIHFRCLFGRYKGGWWNSAISQSNLQSDH